jgi:hypothetical protein
MDPDPLVLDLMDPDPHSFWLLWIRIRIVSALMDPDSHIEPVVTRVVRIGHLLGQQASVKHKKVRYPVGSGSA